MKKKRTQLNDIRAVCVIMATLYVIFAVAFYFLAGEQLHFRKSRGNIMMQAADFGTIELVAGTTVEQVFTTKIQRLKSVTVQWRTYYRTNTGTATVQLIDQESGAVLMSNVFDITEIGEGATTEICANEPIEGLYERPLVLRIQADSLSSRAVSPLMSAAATEEDGYALYFNGQLTQGKLCFSASGEDYIWAGLYYWRIVAFFGLVLSLYLSWTYYRWKHGKYSMLANALTAVLKYKFLIKQLVNRDFKTKYKRSILGVFWSFLNPLLNMLVQYIVFSNLFRFDIAYFPVYLLCGNVIFSFFSEACGMSLTSIVGNAGLITKVYMPKYIYPLTRILSSLINLLISMIPLLAVALISGLIPSKAYFLIPFVLICIALFCLGLGMLLATAMVFFRDIQFLWGVLITIWMYLTPIFYPISILPDNIAWVLKINPLYYYITFMRTCVIDGISPEPIMYVQCFLIAMGMLLAGTIIFKKMQDRFVLYL